MWAVEHQRRTNKNAVTRKLCSTLVLAGLFIAFLGSCGSRHLLTYDQGSYSLNEFESRTISVRLIDDSGNPIVGRRVRFYIEGNANGARIEPIVGQTGEDGVAITTLVVQYETTFDIVAKADGAEDIRIAVSVSRINGGALRLTVYTRSAASIGEAQLILVENFSCSNFDPERPPAPDPQSPYPSKNIVASPSGALVIFNGLRAEFDYAVVAVGVGNGNTRGRGCIDGIRTTQEQIDRRIAITESMFVEDFATDPSGNDLLVETRFSYPLRLNQVASLYRDMVDGPYDPIDFIIDHAVANSDNSFLVNFVAAIRDEVAPLLYNNNANAQLTKIRLQNFVQKLEDINNIRMITSFEFIDETPEDEDAQNEPGEPSLTHTFKYFTADIGDRQEQYFVRPGQRLGAANQPQQLILKAEGVPIDLSDASRIKIDAHELSVPVADAIIIQLLLETFNETDIRAVVAGAVNCSTLANAIADYIFGPSFVGSPFDLFGILRTVLVTAGSAGCRQVALDAVNDTFDRITEDMQAAGFGATVQFEGSADVTKLPDNRTINFLSNGRWIGVGTFASQRI